MPPTNAIARAEDTPGYPTALSFKPLLAYLATMKKCWLAIILLLVAANSAFAQDFPLPFIGHWKGELLWYKTGTASPQTVPMQLIIQPADTVGHYTWQIIYGANNSDNRPYLLKPVDTDKGHWLIDERNGIRIDQYWVGGRFASAFTVQSTTIVDSYWIEGDSLIAEFYSLSAAPVSSTGSGTDEVPTVKSYAAKGYQRAVLRKHQDDR